jgi:hypothetical protein
MDVQFHLKSLIYTNWCKKQKHRLTQSSNIELRIGNIIYKPRNRNLKTNPHHENLTQPHNTIS